MRSDILKKYVLPTVLLAAVIWIIYRWLGGGADQSFSIVEQKPLQLRGYMYKGRPASDELESYFFELRDLSSFDDGNYLTLVSFGSENTVDTLRQFIGTQNTDVPDRLSSYEIPGGKYVRVVLDMHSLVRPSPGQIREEAEEFAQNQDARLGDWNLEIFTGEEELTVLFPVI
ncbi:MAG: hypothetical protein P8X57_00260 [Cyclobacteriaceae bacterium]